jgi:glutamine amidotransferase
VAVQPRRKRLEGDWHGDRRQAVIAIIDYGSGNIQAIANIYKRLGVAHSVASTADHIKGAARYLLPGVGAFDRCMQELNKSGMREALDRAVLMDRKPILGICVGMQILARSSEEGREKGLGWINGDVKRFDPATFHQATRLPHMGWNTTTPVQTSPLFEGVDLSTGYYFLHSYYFVCDRRDNVLAETEYGSRFAAAVHANNVFGVQFHPEKSHQAGIQLLKNFAAMQ